MEVESKESLAESPVCGNSMTFYVTDSTPLHKSLPHLKLS